MTPRKSLLTLVLAASASLAGAQPSEPVADGAVLALIATAVFPKARALSITVVPPVSLPLAIINGATFPTARPLTVMVEPATSPLALIKTARFPIAQPVRVTVERGEILQLSTVFTGLVTPSISSGPPNPEALAAVAAANFPPTQPLSVTLVPQASPLSAIASASFPATQPLSVTLVPSPTPLAAIATASFPVPQPLSVTLYAGEPLQAAPLVAGIVPGLTLAPPVYTVQIVQVIPRRGVNFFDARNPAGAPQATVFAQAGGGGAPAGPVCVPPATPPVTGEICGTTLSLSDDGFPFGANLGPQGNRSFFLTPAGGTDIQIAAQTGISPTAACPSLLCMATQVFTPGAACNTLDYDDTGTPKSHVVKLRRNGGQVCAQLLQ